MMVRTQISLDAETHARASARAASLGISLAEYMRRLADRDLADSPRKDFDIACVFDLGASEGSTDIAAQKERMIAEATAAAKPRYSDAS